MCQALPSLGMYIFLVHKHVASVGDDLLPLFHLDPEDLDHSLGHFTEDPSMACKS